MDEALPGFLDSIGHQVPDEPIVARVDEAVGKVEGRLPDGCPKVPRARDQGPGGRGGGREQGADNVGDAAGKLYLAELNGRTLRQKLWSSSASMKNPGVAMEDTECKEEGGYYQLDHHNVRTTLYYHQSNSISGVSTGVRVALAPDQVLPHLYSFRLISTTAQMSRS